MKLIKPIAKFTLVTQILFPLLFSATSVASAVNTKKEKASHREVLAKIQSNLPELTSKQTEDAHSMTGDELLAQGLNKSAQIISQDNSNDAAKNLAQSTAYGFVSNQMTNWLNQYGNATIQIGSDKAFSGEYFLPFYETEDNLFFSQSRIQRQNEDRTTLNLGLGYRYFMTNKMLGINSFYDHDLKNHNARWGLGAEFGADYIKLAANGYFRLTDWRNSRLSAFHDYDERPANGFDIKAEGFLPNYPQLGANIKYEKYFGDKVNLKGSNSISDLKKDPQAYTVGISYTPVPLLSFSLNQSMGDVNETKGELAVNYRFGVPLSQQLDTDLVQQMRTLMGARYNPVDRNNTIVMQYQHKKQELLQIDFDQKSYQINSGGHTKLTPIIHHNNEIARVIYESHNELFNGIDDTYISSTNDYSADFNVPAYNSTSNSNTYEVNVYAVDVKGNRSNTVTLTISVAYVIQTLNKETSRIWVTNDESDKLEEDKRINLYNNESGTVNAKLFDTNGYPILLNSIHIYSTSTGVNLNNCKPQKNKPGWYKCDPTTLRDGGTRFKLQLPNGDKMFTDDLIQFVYDVVKWDFDTPSYADIKTITFSSMYRKTLKNYIIRVTPPRGDLPKTTSNTNTWDVPEDLKLSPDYNIKMKDDGHWISEDCTLKDHECIIS